MTQNTQTKTFSYVGNLTQEELFEFYNNLNKDLSNHKSNDDICTPMECVKTMIDYIPKELW